ncbi:3-phosphoshikimate 1-carboxyvinyltransferase [Brumimicrobium oceani]|uniref:3-phosphoshikimate 1-carboxyvinyltransferase n=1 Tax=Brumimicrobium oceani TaxID=2100725 RepID=A0A2U2XGH0_9FLAO|nr:3-phosphoshikimate 1-carboxyvinyltransferase [Brumimicrobium oceani]PWH86801.1 3-phosphoshikimate 1-carboxyvinyltransferase [Brumimicrobium oceani]
MNKIRIPAKNSIDGTLTIPSSKSYAQRAIALAGLSKSSVVIRNLTDSDDVLAAQGIIAALGAIFVRSGKDLILKSGIDMNCDSEISINCKESGLSTRLFSSFSLLFDEDFTVNGEGSIAQRTMEMVIDGLAAFGKSIDSNKGKIPLKISGKTLKKKVEIDGSISSQFLTGVLIVTSFLKRDTEIRVPKLKSKPYIEMTLDLMRYFGLKVEHKDFEIFQIKGNQSIGEELVYEVEGDWSAASFHIVAAAVGGHIQLKGLKADSRQGDKVILDAVKRAGASVEWRNGDLIIQKDELLPFEFDAGECPDLFPPLAVLAAYASGKSTISGVHRLKHKESDRGITLQQEFAKIGVRIDLNGDEMVIHGKGTPIVQKEVTFSSHNDHRIAMAMSLLSIGAEKSIYIEHAGAVDKSYPDFYKDFLTI